MPASETASPGPVASSFDRYGRWQFGFSGGKSTGGGLALRRWFDAKNGVELHGYVFLSKQQYPNDGSSWGRIEGRDGHPSDNDTGTAESAEIQLGVQYLHEVLDVNLSQGGGFLIFPTGLRCLGFVGVGGYADRLKRNLHSSRYEYSYSTYSGKHVPYEIVDSRSTQKLQGGAGGGAELEFGRLSIHLLVGIGGYYQLDPAEYAVGPTADGGIFLRF